MGTNIPQVVVYKRCGIFPEHCFHDLDKRNTTHEGERGTDCPNLVGLDRVRRKLQVQASVGLSYCSNYPTRNSVLDDVSIVGLIDTNKQTSLGATMRPSVLEIVAKSSEGAEKPVGTTMWSGTQQAVA